MAEMMQTECLNERFVTDNFVILTKKWLYAITGKGFVLNTGSLIPMHNIAFSMHMTGR